MIIIGKIPTIHNTASAYLIMFTMIDSPPNMALIPDLINCIKYLSDEIKKMKESDK